ncbi:MAG: acyl carrier protein [Myxococcota bacterium]|nr:acyl carrier protein [Myxococcota bacterium]
MDASEISERIQCFLEREFPNEGVALALDTNLLEDWFIDSLGITETVLFLESSFGIRLSRADISGENFKDIESLSALVARRSAE